MPPHCHQARTLLPGQVSRPLHASERARPRRGACAFTYRNPANRPRLHAQTPIAEGATGERYNQRLEAAEQMAQIEARWQHLPGGFHGERKRIKIHIQAVADTTQVMSSEELCWLAIAAVSAWLPNRAPAEAASPQSSAHSGHRSGAIREPEAAIATIPGMQDTST